MSAEQTQATRRTVRQFALALVACLAVAGGAALVSATDGPSAATQQQAGTTTDWPAPIMKPVSPVN
ncbi:hypothetical protein [Streptomyces laurentii]|uniref:hypothetical protein n=1 Tax=Streptomyces laurentii TaxID=39478 RepID=UPI003679CB5D